MGFQVIGLPSDENLIHREMDGVGESRLFPQLKPASSRLKLDSLNGQFEFVLFGVEHDALIVTVACHAWSVEERVAVLL